MDQDNQGVHLLPEDVPGAILRSNVLQENSVRELQRWLECRGLQKTGTKPELIRRVENCIACGRADTISVSIDDGKWYDQKLKVPANLPSTSGGEHKEEVALWNIFPGATVPVFFNKGHVYSYIIGSGAVSEEHEEVNQLTGSTEKPFRRGMQYVDSDFIFNLCDSVGTNYNLKGQVRSSFNASVSYNVQITLNAISGAVISGTCNCKQSLMGRCSHVAALLLFLNEFVTKSTQNISPTSLPREWGKGSTKRNASAVTEAEYPKKHYLPQHMAVFDPRPESYTRSQDSINSLIVDLDASEPCMFSELLEIHYEDFVYTDEDISVIKVLRDNLKKNMADLLEASSTDIIHIKGTYPQGSEDWLRWRTYFLTASVVKEATCLADRKKYKTFIKRNLWALNKFHPTAAMVYGSNSEEHAIKYYMDNLLQEGEEYVTCGLLVNRKFPHLACSPDGIVAKGGINQRTVEIKCPKLLEHHDPKDFDVVLSQQQKSGFCLEINSDGSISLKQNHKYAYQIALQMLICDVQVSHLVIWTRVSSLVLTVTMDSISHLIPNIVNTSKFYYNVYVPEMFCQRVPRDLLPLEFTSC